MYATNLGIKIFSEGDGNLGQEITMKISVFGVVLLQNGQFLFLTFDYKIVKGLLLVFCTNERKANEVSDPCAKSTRRTESGRVAKSLFLFSANLTNTC